MPVGYLVTVALAAWCTFFAVAPPRPSHTSPFSLAYVFGFLVNELPIVLLAWLVASTALLVVQGDTRGPVALVAIVVAVVTAGALGVAARRGLRAGLVVDRAMADGLGPSWRLPVEPRWAESLGRRPSLARRWLFPFPVRPRAVERVANVAYGPFGRRNRLDLFRHRSHPPGAPVLVYLHGGAYHSGRKNREARPLLYRFARRGWLCISANYRLSPAATFPDPLVDLKRVIEWVREHGPEFGADPTMLVVSGSSAGGHLAAMAALTPNDPEFQPGFERANTSVSAAVCLYAYLGPVGSRAGGPASPAECLRPDAPPFFVAHGDLDTLVLVEDAREFVRRLRATSTNPVVYAELPGAHHGFDVLHSPRFESVVDGIEGFTAWVRSTTAGRRGPAGPGPGGAAR